MNEKKYNNINLSKKKSNGVFYTFNNVIVDYIVKNTLGKLIEGKTPEEISKIKIIDPSCGIGLFLIGTYDCLIKYHTQYYTQNKIYEKLNKDGKLKIDEKKRILLNNIFGVDIDNNAIDIAKSNLILKTIDDKEEGEKDDIVSINLEKNLKCGNSLVENDFFNSFINFDKENIDKLKKELNPFDWKNEFSDIFNNGGFDIVIGNPPWVSLSGKHNHSAYSKEVINYLIKKYNGNKYMPNLYEHFINLGLNLVKKNGYFSFIVPDRFGFNEQFVNLRKRILLNFTIEELIYKVDFEDIVADTLIFIIRNVKNENYKITVGEFGKDLQIKDKKEYLNDVKCKFGYEINNDINVLLNKIFQNPRTKPLGGENGLFETKTGVIIEENIITEKRQNDKQVKIIKGRNIQSFYINGNLFCELNKKYIKGGTSDINKLTIKEKIFIRKTGFPIYASYDNSGLVAEHSAFFLISNKYQISLKYITALINSKLFQFCYWHNLITNRFSFPHIKKVDLDKFPVFVVDINNKKEKNIYDEIVYLVDEIIKIKNNMDVDSSIENTYFYRDKIDTLFFNLYDLKESDIKLINNNLPIKNKKI